MSESKTLFNTLTDAIMAEYKSDDKALGCMLEIGILEARDRTLQWMREMTASNRIYNTRDIANKVMDELINSLTIDVMSSDPYTTFGRGNDIKYKRIEGNIKGGKYFSNLVTVQLLRVKIGRHKYWIEPSHFGTIFFTFTDGNPDRLVTRRKPCWFIPRCVIDTGVIPYTQKE